MGHEIIRVTRRNPCPVCKKADWCGVSNGYAICMRVPSDKPTSNGGWLHSQGSTPIVSVRSLPLSKKAARASDAFLDKAYRAFVEQATLSPGHRENLRSRGLSDADIGRAMYRSAPNGHPVAIGYDMAIVPGFMKRPTTGKWHCTAPHGILIPVRDMKRRIIGFQVRLDEPQSKNKYIWLSSASSGGPSPGARPHLAVPSGKWPASVSAVWITEGILKADIAATRIDAPVIGVPGVSCWKAALPLITKLNPQTVVIAYDDDYEKEQVRIHARALADALLMSGFKVYAALWRGSGYKGLDDALVAGANIRLVQVKQKRGGQSHNG